MIKDKILVIGADGPIGAELTRSLREVYGNANVVGADLRAPDVMLTASGPYEQLNVLQPVPLAYIIQSHRITQIYILVSIIPSATEKNARDIWDFQIRSLLNVLEIAKELNVKKVFWPSHIAVSGHTIPSAKCLQHAGTAGLTLYGLAKQAGEQWCQWHHYHRGVDVRSIRIPGIVAYVPGEVGGITDFATDMFHSALRRDTYQCYLNASSRLPMLYLPDALRAIHQLMEAPASNIRIRTAYHVAGINFTPAELAAAIKKEQPDFTIRFEPDYRQCMADLWPEVVSDEAPRLDFGWQADYDLETMTISMLDHLQRLYRARIVE